MLVVGGGCTTKAIRNNWPLFVMCIAGFGIYILVLPEYRYVGAYVAILWLALLSPFRAPTHLLRISGVLSLAVAFVLLVTVVDSTVRAARIGGSFSAVPDIALSDRLDSMGLRAGDRMGTVGIVGV